MTRCPSLLRNLISRAYTLLMLLMDARRFLLLCLRPSPALAAENLFLRKQLALYQERQIKPRRTMQATRIALMAPRAGHRPTSHVDPLASSGVPGVLAMDISRWTTADSN